MEWSRVVSNGFDGNPKNGQCTGFITFNGYLYTAFESSSDNPTEVWRTDDGTTWTQANITGFGDVNNYAAGGFAIYNDYLYLGMGDSMSGQIWRSSNGTSWSPVLSNGFGDVNNIEIEMLFAFDNYLYAGVRNWTTGVEIWRTSNSADWVQINPDGFGDSNNGAVEWSNSTVIFNGNLYMGTWAIGNGGELWQLQRSLYLPMVKR